MINTRFKTFILTSFIAFVMSLSPSFAAEFMSVSKAHQQSKAGQVHLVDIRRPSEWKQTGVAKHASKITMHKNGFLSRIAAAFISWASKSSIFAISLTKSSPTASPLKLERLDLVTLFNSFLFSFVRIDSKTMFFC